MKYVCKRGKTKAEEKKEEEKSSNIVENWKQDVEWRWMFSFIYSFAVNKNVFLIFSLHFRLVFLFSTKKKKKFQRFEGKEKRKWYNST